MILNFPKVREVPAGEQENPHFSYVETQFDTEYEKRIRYLTRTGDPEKDAEMPPQDRLVYAFVTVNRTTGMASEFCWASGRKDVHVLVDYPRECVSAEVVRERAELIEKLKEAYHGKGFAHHEYDGGFAEFARNYQQATGSPCAPEVAALCGSELAQAA